VPPDPVTEQGDRVLEMWWVLLALSTVIGAIVVGATVWAVVRYRARGRDDLPEQTHGHGVLEAVAVGVPLAIVAGLFAYILRVNDDNTAEADDPDVVVEVTSYRWGWEFRYPEEDVTVSAGPGEEPELVLPVDADVRLELETTDVVHSFFVPRFLTKLDLIPEEVNVLDVTTTETGEFPGRCAEFCGLDHARMNFVVRVEDQDGYRAWIDENGGRP
jgi:cytochrome c oxidase subunit 2